MGVDWTFFAIRPSIVISSLCYSIFRVEPYSICTYQCIYCYARWYRRNMSRYEVLKEWKKLVEKLSKADIPPPYFRLSTLVEPFQESLESKHYTSLEIMKLACKYKVPLVINTKSTLIRESPWIDVILSLADEGLVLVQISLITKNDDLSKILEPNAPTPESRLKVIEELREHEVPVVARIQPLIPGIEDQQLEVTDMALDHGSLGIIVEPLRETKDGVIRIAKVLGEEPRKYLREYQWEPYPSSLNKSNIFRPGLEWRKGIFTKIAQLTLKYGRIMSICKDGIWYNFSHYGLDCCQAWHMKSNYSMRRTLHEYLMKPEDIPKHIHLMDNDDFMKYPRPIRRALKLHQNKLKKVLKRKDLLTKFMIS
ncbi:MAG: hypothetical protein DRZ82_03475 [Thermoprotei archaeon]|nr:MAG: hypothetical protein DRZ82_03475 [Thermoprotei archaeon]